MGQKNAKNPLQEAKQKLTALLEKSQGLSEKVQIESLEVKGFERVLKVTEPSSGLKAIIAIHNTTLGPALGGTRIHSYSSFEAGLEDALRLAEGMTYKSAVAQVGFGGGKSVILADPQREKTPEKLLAFARVVESLQGAYICAEDAGCSTEDVRIFRRETQYVVGLPSSQSSGDPSPFTAWGVFRGIQSVLQKLFQSDSVEGRTIALQGLGNVGKHLAEFLFWAGAKLIVTDRDEAKVKAVARRFGAKQVAPEEIFSVPCDVFSPCALGGVICDDTLPLLQCKAIVGAANNQLREPVHADMLREKKILYAPDFVVNAGGLLNVAAELEPEGYQPISPRLAIHRIYETLLAIYKISDSNHESTHQAALSLAEYRLKYKIGKRVLPPTFHHSSDS